jgi:hypothetical protein
MGIPGTYSLWYNDWGGGVGLVLRTGVVRLWFLDLA